MRALVTGAGGFVGQHLVRHLLECGDEVMGVDMRAAPELIDTEYTFRELNVCDGEACARLIGDFKPEVVYHLAAIAFVPEAENNFDRTLSINVGGTNNIVRTCHLLHSGATVLYVSSAEVYGKFEPDKLPLTEEAPLRPANNYSLSKVMGELVLQRYAQDGYVRGVIVRPFNHIGPGQDGRFVASSFAQQLAQIAKGQAEPVLRTGNLEAQRDFSDVRDIVRGYRLVAQKGSGVYNLCSGRAVSIRSMLDMLIQISGLQVRMEKDPSRMRASEIPVMYGSFEKARRELGWQPDHSLESTLTEIYQSCLKKYIR
ncbi:MAG: NAD-dependent epimerase/dehydratase family protein [Deltaproteobacteria bacterium]|nr:NAD-dependent epimerase/dehydratase family protein [Deltaproteobacteria bacterium]